MLGNLFSRGVNKLTLYEENKRLRERVAHLEREHEMAVRHIEDDLQPQLMRLATWWHGVGTDRHWED
jgi:hypothetical protein